MARHNDIAQVLLWGERVGALMVDRPTDRYYFEYDSDFLARMPALEIAPLTMPLREGVYQFSHLPKVTFKGLPGLLADALPDDFGNAAIDAWLAAQGISSQTFTALDRLLYTGHSAIGALEFKPALEGVTQAPAEDMALQSLLRTVQNALDDRGKVGGDLRADSREALASICQVGTSAGGARPRAMVAINREHTRILSGQADAPEGFTHYLLKFDGVAEHLGSSELLGAPQGCGVIEYTYYQMAQECGITMSPSEVLMDGPRAHFLTQRFDRIGNEKVHIQTLCAMDHADYRAPGTYSYEQLFQVARKLRLSRSEAIEIYRRMVFNVLAHNQNDHTRNTAFMMNKEGHWSLAPAFDVAFSFTSGVPWRDQHNMSLNGKRSQFTQADLLRVGEGQITNFRNGAREIFEEVRESVRQWPVKAEENGVPGGMIATVAESLVTELPKS